MDCPQLTLVSTNPSSSMFYLHIMRTFPVIALLDSFTSIVEIRIVNIVPGKTDFHASTTTWTLSNSKIFHKTRSRAEDSRKGWADFKQNLSWKRIPRVQLVIWWMRWNPKIIMLNGTTIQQRMTPSGCHKIQRHISKFATGSHAKKLI